MDAPSGKVALVTGASRGIGRAIAQSLAVRGVRVAVHYRHDRVAAESSLSALAGGGHRLFAADLGAPGAPRRLFDDTLAAFERIDLLVNNAGIYERHAPHEMAFEAWTDVWQRTLTINLVAPMQLAFLVANHMCQRCDGLGGRIINISSRGAFRGEASAPAYGAAKAGLNAGGQSLAKAFARDRVQVLTLAPGWVDTEMADPHLHGSRRVEIESQIPLGRAATPQEVASAATWLALDAPDSMTGCIVDLNGASYLRT